MSNNKSRNLSPIEYLHHLSKEWWINDFRSKIYPKIKDKEYYKKVRELKKQRIIEISNRNDIPCIFDNKQMMNELVNSFIVRGGFPIFDGLKNDDLINYYLPNNDCRIYMGGKVVLLGKIKGFDIKTNQVLVQLQGENDIKSFILTKVSRIL